MNIRVVKADKHDAEMISLIGKIAFRKEFEHIFKNKRDLEDYLKQVYNPDKIALSIGKENNVYFLFL